MFELYYQNVRGIRTKAQDVYDKILLNSYDVIVFTETWLNSCIANNEFIDSRYIVYRKDRNVSTSMKKDGGGVLIAVRNGILSSRVMKWESDCEDLWVTIEIIVNGVSKKIAICSVYLPSPAKLETLKKFIDNTNTVLCQIDDVIIIGDFNQSTISWTKPNDSSHLQPLNYNSNLDTNLVDFIFMNNIFQYNGTLNSDDRILDLVLSNMDNIVVTPPLDILTKVDLVHPPLLISITNVNITFLRPNPRSDPNFFKADYDKIISEIDLIDWRVKFSGCSNVDSVVTVFYSELKNIIAQFVPVRKNINSKYPHWFSKSLIQLLSRKEKIRQKYRRYHNPRDEIEYKYLRNNCNKLFNQCYASYKQKLEDDIIKNPRSFWRFIKDKRGGNSSFPSELQLNGISSNNAASIADLFANHFSSVFTQNSNYSNNKFLSTIPSNITDIINYIQFSESDILKQMQKLDPSKSAGPDGIPPVFIKRCSTSLTLPLQLIINRSLKSGEFPTEWKKARIVPIFKKGDQKSVKNYRPVSILSTFSKIFESLVCPIVTRHVEPALSTFQHGFRPGRSVQTNLTSFINDLTSEIDKGQQIDAIYTDFSSAFDRVDHSILIQKLQLHGFTGSLLNWFKSYLQHRVQRVVVNGCESSPFFATSGVPQGSHLGPILFLLFINDISFVIRNSRFLLFADDLKIYKTVSCTSDCVLVQQDLQRIMEWCNENGMCLNADKCFYIKYTQKKKTLDFEYKINGVTLQKVNEIKDLGVILDQKLQLTAHVNHVVKKSAQMLGFVRRTTKEFRSIRLKIILYNALVRSNLEYACVVWSPSYAVHSQRIEKIQRSFTKHLAFLASGISHRQPYHQRLSFFKMLSLKNRRLIQDISFLHKIVNTSPDSNLLSQISLNVPYHIPRHPTHKQFHIPYSRTNIRLHSPILRLCNNYNFTVSKHKELDIFHDTCINLKKKLVKLLL